MKFSFNDVKNVKLKKNMMNRKFLLINVRNVIERCSVKKGVLEKFTKIDRKAPVLESFLIKLQVRPAIFCEKRPRHRFLSGNFAKFLRTSFFDRTSSAAASEA